MNRLIPLFILIGISALGLSVNLNGNGPDDPFLQEYVLAPADTIPPISERYDDFINTSPTNPFDLEDPSEVKQNVEYDPESGLYIIKEKIGDDYFRPPTYMTFSEYMKWRREKEERDYFNKLAGIKSDADELVIKDPIEAIDVKNDLVDRLFGGTEVEIRPQGSIDLTFGVDFQRVENPILPERQRRQGGFDFDMDIQMNVTGKIGEKLTLTTNYNTNATFNFDRQNIKLDYNSDLFGEDEIIKKIEAGNVSLPLRGTLIQGAQSLFGIKTELQFGHLRLTAIASQQKSKNENIKIEGGSQLQEFEVDVDEYDENRHFFLSHYNRDVFEYALESLPYINTLFKLEEIEVWITNDRREVENVREIVALADLAEPQKLVNPEAVPPFSTPKYHEIGNGKPLPDNGANPLYAKIKGFRDVDKIDQVVSTLQSPQFGLVQSRDFEKVSARKLNSREYTIHRELGIISVNINVQSDQVLAVGYRYKYNGEIYRVGDLSVNTDPENGDTTTTSSKVLFVKMLKSTTQRTDVPTWDLMMKNVYSIGAYQVNPEDFRLDIFYDDPGKGQKRFLPKTNLAGEPLLRVFNLDALNTQGDPQRDGVFDFVPGVTINPSNGRIMFPVLEPFGSYLGDKIDDPGLRDSFIFQELYDSTLFRAQEFPEKSRFVIKGTYKSSVSSEISLGAFNIPPGSVRVSAGGAQMLEGRDYEVDYSTGRLRILNDAILASGVPINISFEDNTLFGFESKTMVGLRADYELGKDFNIGATFLQLFERPFTQKVNLTDDPINNKIYGLDLSFSKEAPWLTKAVDAIPLISTKEASNISFMAETAYLNPGHARAINETKKNKDGVVYIDDFEGGTSGYDLRTPANKWYMASVPQNDDRNRNPLFPEVKENSIVSGANRAKLSWFRVDPSARGSGDDQDPYTKLVPEEEVFPNAQITPDRLPNIQTFDLMYFPDKRGPYNFDTPAGYPGLTSGVRLEGDEVLLKDPESRWGGVMRELPVNDFQSANIEFLEFWMLSPFHDTNDPTQVSPDVDGQQGTLYFNLGNVSEDILKDSRLFYENGLPNPNSTSRRRVDETIWSYVPASQQITRSFDLDEGAREAQDVGLDGADNEKEREKFADYLQALRDENSVVAAEIEKDPSNDDYRYYGDSSFPDGTGLRERYLRYNNPQGNSPANTGSVRRQSNTNYPDAEDLNQDNTLNETEAYFQYEIPLKANPTNPRELSLEDTPYITDVQAGDGGKRLWYRFRIPLREPDKSVGGIKDFRSIRFMRMYMHGFEKPVILRFARLELVRNQWRRYEPKAIDNGQQTQLGCDEKSFQIDAVSIEENSSREPFNYVLPVGIKREQSLGVFNTLQNEQSQVMKVEKLCDGSEAAIFKYVEQDLRLYDSLKMFVHAESVELDPGDITPDGATRLFMRFGSDFRNNYYEYEIPLIMSDEDDLITDNPNSDDYKNEVWKKANEFLLELKGFKELKEQRNDEGLSPTQLYEQAVSGSTPGLEKYFRVKGNPNLGFVKVMMIGVRNPVEDQNDGAYSIEVWLNELRVTGLNEKGGFAGLARLDMQLADLGTVTLSGNVSTIGFGALDENLHERRREKITGYDMAANLNLEKFLPKKWGVRVPFYAQISNITETPEYDPYDFDLTLEEKLKKADAVEKDSLKQQAQTATTIKTYNFTNVRKESSNTNSDKKPKPWDIDNFSVSYSYTETDFRDPIIEFSQEQVYRGGLDYSFSRKVKYLEPFKEIKSKHLKLISEINLNPLPNSFRFSTYMDRKFTRTRYRFTGLSDLYNTYFLKHLKWDRDYDMKWDLTKSLKFNFFATSNSIIDEPDELAIQEDPTITDIKKYRRDSIFRNMAKLGRPKHYTHSLDLTYKLPLKYLPFMDWIDVRAKYNADYNWDAAPLNFDSLGNVIQNSQRRQLNVDLNFEKFYNQFDYLKQINRPARKNTKQRQQPNRNTKAEEEDDKKKKKKNAAPGALERALIRPLMLVRKARVSYSEDFSTVVPGFMPDTKILGMASGFEGPGVGFVAGLQPKIRTLSEQDRYKPGDWLYDNREWITPSVFLNQDMQQDYSSDFNAQLTLEPFPDFKIDLEANRSYTQNYTETFKDTTLNDVGDYVHSLPIEYGSMTVSYSALSTLFNDSSDEIVKLFETYESNRLIISNRLGTGIHTDSLQQVQGYSDGFGRSQQEVLIPAFIAAYNNLDAKTVDTDIFDLLPRVNWKASYDGLSKIPLFNEIFQNFRIEHGYRSSLTINRYNTSTDYLDTRDISSRDTTTGNFYPRLNIPELVIQEAFAPLIAVSAEFYNGVSFTADYQKSRTLAMSFINKTLNETQSKEISLGFGYKVAGINIGFLTGNNKKKKGKKKKAEEDDPQNTNTNNRNQGPRGGRGGLEPQDLDFSFDFSLRDDVTFAHRLDAGIIEPTRGTFQLSLSPAAEYQINKQLSLRLFFDYRKTVPKTSQGYPRTDFAGGVVVSFKLE